MHSGAAFPSKKIAGSFFRQEIDFLIAAIKTHKTRVKNVQRKFVKFLWWLKRFHELVVFILHLSKLISL